MVVRLSGTQPQGPKHLETLENKTVDGTQNTVRVNRGTTANRPIGPVIGDLYYNTELKDLEQYTEDGWMLVAKQVPRVPTIGSATLDGSNNASISFTPSTYGQPASSYTVQSNPGSYTATASSSPISISGTNLQADTAYTFRVKSIGVYGESAYSAYTSSVTPIALGNFDSIQSITVGAGGANGISFNNIPQTYKHLQIRFTARGSGTGGTAAGLKGTFININNDFSTTVPNHALYGNGTSAISGYSGDTRINLIPQTIPGSSATSNVFGATIMDILDYSNNNKFKTIRAFTGVDVSGAGQISLVSACWNSTGSVTSIQIGTNEPFVQYSKISLYGVKQ